MVQINFLENDRYFCIAYKWAIWRAFLAMNYLIGSISNTRNFQIDEDLKPIYNKKGTIPSMVFEYKNFIIVCEGSLYDSEEEWSAEYCSMPRYVCKKLVKTDKLVFGIFVAPKIEPNLCQQLFKATWYVNGEYVELNIIPFSTEQLVNILTLFRGKNSVQDLKGVLIKLVEMKKAVSNGKEWYELLSKELQAIFNVK